MKIEELPFHLRKIIVRCRDKGDTLCVQHRMKDTGSAETICFYMPSGKVTGTKSALAAIAIGFMEPLGDSLLDPTLSQTWRAL